VQDSLTEKKILRGLKTNCFGKNIIILPVVTSTMDVARQEINNGAPEGTAIIAERQTTGHGRLKRTWITTSGNIAVSIIIYPPKKYLQSLIMLGSLAVANAIQNATGIKCQLKWPNDIMIRDKKVCGILIETKTHIDRLDYAILGIGINVNMKTLEYPELMSQATSLSQETDKPVSRVKLLRQLFIEMERLYSGLLSGKSLYVDWKRGLTTLGKAVRIQSGDNTLEGTAESVNIDGSLMLRLVEGSLIRITIGDVSLREQQEKG
jgi:BirA family biotin operon repressor/biotin-[acetyl-CoA-carboxylase] ligase